MKQDSFEIGKLIKTHGIHGELVLEIKNPDFCENIKESVLLEIEGLLVPFFIASLKQLSSDRLRISFDWYITENKVRNLVGANVFLPNDNLNLSQTDFENNLGLLTGFMVIDEKTGELGTINYVVDNEINQLISVTYQKREILIPLHTDFIIAINPQKKSITLRCPEGLIDLYTD